MESSRGSERARAAGSVDQEERVRMFPWRLGKKRPPDEAPKTTAPAPGRPEEEWAFLREQPDWDADEMSSVHGEASPRAGKAEVLAAPALSGRPVQVEAVEAAVLDPIPEPHRRAKPPVPGRTAPGPGAAAEPDGPTLALEVTVGRRTSVRRVAGDALLGRYDGAGPRPEIDLSGDPEVSRRHALLCIRAGSYVLRDLRSDTGTWHNGGRLQADRDARLAVGDEIEVGARTVIRVLGASTAPALTVQDVILGDMAQDLMRSTPAPPDLLELALEQGQSAGLLALEQPGSAPGGDMLDIALERGEQSGLLGGSG